VKHARKRFLSVVVLIAAMAAPLSLTADDPKPLMGVEPQPLMTKDSELMIAARKLMETVGNGKWAELLKATRCMKEAGLSFQEGLLTPREGVIDCKDRGHQMQVLVGIYMTDVNYAAAFGKVDIESATAQFLNRDVSERLAVRPKIGFISPDLSSQKQFWEGDHADEATWDAFFAEVQATIEKSIRAAEKDRDVMGYVVDRLYGNAIESMYLSCKLSLGAPSGEKLIPVFNTVTARIDMVLPALEALKDPELKTWFQQTKRVVFLNAVKDIIRKKGGNLTATDVKDILALVEPIRNSYIAKCS